MKWLFDRMKERLAENRYDSGKWRDARDITTKGYDRADEDESTVGTWEIARGMSTDQFTNLLDNWLNSGGKRENEGYLVGLNLRNTHRTLQGNAVMFMVGMLAGIAEQEHTDARNESAISTAKKIISSLEDSDAQRYI